MNNKVLKASFAKCDGCGSGMIFSPEKQNLICEHCKSVKEFEKSKEYTKHDLKEKPSSFEGYKEWREENKVMRCETCGAEVVLHNLEYSGTCPYCGSSYVSETKKLPGLVPDAVIPFKFDEEGASERFKAGVKRKFFVPRTFKKRISTDKIKGIYVPTFAFDANTQTSYSGTLNKTERRGEDTYVRRFKISGTQKLNIVDELVETSSQLTQDQLRKIMPYNMKEAFKFDENFIRGYVVEHFETAFDQCYKDAKQAMLEEIKSSILQQYTYDTVESFNMNPSFSDEKYSYKLVPVYRFEYQYKNKRYTTEMNGQTGKVGGGLPISGWRVFLVVLLVLAFIAGVTVLTLLTD